MLSNLGTRILNREIHLLGYFIYLVKKKVISDGNIV